MDIAVVILNWNGKALLEKFLPTVVKFSKQATIYVADNASTDRSVAYVKDYFPQVKIIQNPSNGGYAKGYNQALSQLSEELFILLNSDVEVTENWLTPLLTEFDTHPKTAIVQPKILAFHQKDSFEYAGAGGGFIDKLGYPYCRGRIFDSIEKDHGQYDDRFSIFWASGACLAIRKNVFEEIGMLDEAYFAHQEEIDLCWRAQHVGHQIIYIGQSVVYHMGGATLASISPQKSYLNFRNSLFNLLKNKPGMKVLAWLLLRMLLDGLAALKFLCEGKPAHFKAVLKAHGSFYRAIPQLLKKRKQIKKTKISISINSIVWKHFILKKNTYLEL